MIKYCSFAIFLYRKTFVSLGENSCFLLEKH
jgi:hypothetical protein